jgi:hypothetical protein
MGRLLNVRYLNDAGVSEELLGTLVSFQAGSIVIEQGGKNREIARSSIQKAVQELVMAHPKKGEKRRK